MATEATSLSLGCLLDGLTGVVEAIAPSDRQLDRRVHGLVVIDATEAAGLRTIAPGALVVLVGVDGSGEPPEAVRHLLDSQAAGIVVKAGADVHQGWQTRMGPALLLASRDLSWLDLLPALSALLETGSPGGGDVSGADLSELVDSLSVQIDASVLVEDCSGQILGHSPDSDPVDSWRRDAILRKRAQWPTSTLLRRYGLNPTELAGGGVLAFSMPGARQRLVAGLPGDHGTVGYLWAAIPDGRPAHPDADPAVDTIRAAAPVIGRAVARIAAERRSAAVRLSQVLTSALENPSLANLHRLGLTPATPVSLLVGRRTDAARGVWHDTESLRTRIVMSCGSAAVASAAGAVEVLVDESRTSERDRRKLAELMAASGAGVAYIRGDARDIARLFGTALAMLELISDGAPGVYEPHHLWGALHLRRLAHQLSDRYDLASGGAASLIRHDADHGTLYAATLRLYLDSLGDIQSVARGLLVHPNTVRYRLGVIRKLLDVDLENAENRLVLHLQLALADRSGQGQRAQTSSSG